MRLLISTFSVTIALAPCTTAQEVLFPPALAEGDTIALVAPAGPVDDRDVERYADYFRGHGFHMRIAGNIHDKRGNMAGDDATRAREFMAAWRDPGVRAVWPITGGYGTVRFLDQIDYDAIRADPKLLIGMSDITGLHCAIGRETGLVTFLGPNAAWPLNRDKLPPCEYAEDWLWHAISSDSYFDPTGALWAPGYTYEFPTAPHDPDQASPEWAAPATLVSGVARGRLVGGNLSLVSALVGTPYQPETDGRILVLEDVRERPYRIDRMLCQMQLAGMLDNLAGVVLGTWRRCEPEDPDDSLTLAETLADYFAEAPYPVMLNFPTGHVPEQATLPLNCLAELDAANCTLTLLENPVVPRP